jgi:purine-binding chemotaxis protein CheW
VSARTAASPQAWCTFRLAEGHYGVELARVQEVLRPLPLTRVPLAPPAIAGLVNLRGRIVTVVDPRVVLGVDAAPAASGGLVVVHGTEGAVALQVDAIGDVRRADATEPPPALAGSTADGDRDAISQTIALPGHLLSVLDLDRVLARAFAADVPTFRPPAGETRS